MDMAHMLSDFKTDTSASSKATVDGRKPKWKRIVEAMSRGMTLAQAAKHVGTTYGSAKVMLWMNRRKISKDQWSAMPQARVGKGVTASIRLPHAVDEALCAEAERRGMTRNKLIATALSMIVKDGLINAVMDGDDEQ